MVDSEYSWEDLKREQRALQARQAQRNRPKAKGREQVHERESMRDLRPLSIHAGTEPASTQPWDNQHIGWIVGIAFVLSLLGASTIAYVMADIHLTEKMRHEQMETVETSRDQQDYWDETSSPEPSSSASSRAQTPTPSLAPVQRVRGAGSYTASETDLRSLATIQEAVDRALARQREQQASKP